MAASENYIQALYCLETMLAESGKMLHSRNSKTSELTLPLLSK